MQIATPVIAVCLMVTTPEVNDAAHSTVLKQELAACAVCNTKDCMKPAWFDEAVKAANTLNELQSIKKELKAVRQKEKTANETRRRGP